MTGMSTKPAVRLWTKTGPVSVRKALNLVRTWIWIVICCGVLGVAGCERTAESPATSPKSSAGAAQNSGLVVIPPDSPQLQHVRAQPVETAQVPTNEVTAPAKIVLNPNRISRVALPVPGRVVSVLVRLGDGVTQGQVLLTIESPDGDAAIATMLQAEASERQAKAALVKAQADFDRLRDLYELRAAAQKEVLAAQNDLTQAKETLEQARAAREQALRKLELLGLKRNDFRQRIAVRAPIAGKVLEIGVVPGEYRNDTAAPLMTVADLTIVWVSAQVPEPSIRFIQLGEPVEITLVAYPGETFHGRVARVADTLDSDTRTLKVHVELANPDGRLRPDMFGSVRHAGASRTLPALPTAAIFHEYGSSFVFVERGAGQFERREVTIGARRGDIVPVLNGLSPGDRVVIDGAMLIKGR